jgi:hypothetical protein
MRDADPSFSVAQWETARKGWSALPWREQRRVSRLSKRGQLHPDPVIAETAYRWAVIRVHIAERDAISRPVAAILLAIVTLPLYGGTAGISIQSWRTVRMARRIVAVTEKNSVQRPRGRVRLVAAR